MHRCTAGHDCHDLPSCEAAYDSLFSCIDTPRLRCLNERTRDSIKGVFRPFSQRADTSKFVESDADEQLLIYVPFTANVSLRTITIAGPEGDEHPRTVKLFSNRNDIDFDKAQQLPALVELSLQPDPRGACEYALRPAHFQGLQDLTIFVSGNFGADSTRIDFIGLRGTSMKVVRDTIITIAEVAARPQDHPTAVAGAQPWSTQMPSK
eukprot:m.8958 g.8958  ORF g.8958 m.8958 type:complete len:208 (-) comp5318_c0_seq1:26-649(-)